MAGLGLAVPFGDVRGSQPYLVECLAGPGSLENPKAKALLKL